MSVSATVNWFKRFHSVNSAQLVRRRERGVHNAGDTRSCKKLIQERNVSFRFFQQTFFGRMSLE